MINIIFAKLSLIVIITIFIICSNGRPSIPDQDVSVNMRVVPEEVKVVGSYYFEGSDANEPVSCSNSGQDKPEGILMTFIIELLGDLVDGRANNFSYDVKLMQKLPFESKLIEAAYRDSEGSELMTSIPSYAGKRSFPYFILSADFLEIFFGNMLAADFPRIVEIKVSMPCCAAPFTAYSYVMIRSMNDNNRLNNSDEVDSYIGLAYDRRYGLEDFESLRSCKEESKDNVLYEDDFSIKFEQ